MYIYIYTYIYTSKKHDCIQQVPVGVTVRMRINHKLGKHAVLNRVDGIANNAQNIEPEREIPPENSDI